MKINDWHLILLFAILASIPFLVPGCGWVALFAFIPLLIFADRCASGQVRRKGWKVYLAFMLLNLATTFWINWISVPGAIAAIGLNALQMYAIFMLYLLCRKHFGAKVGYLLLVAGWIAWEKVYQNIEISWPWLILGNSFATCPRLVQWYEYTGFLGGSLWIWLTNIAVYETLKLRGRCPDHLAMRRTVTAISATILLIAAPIASSLAIYCNYSETCNPVEVVAVQPNINAYTEKHGGLSQQVQDERMLSLVDSVITPATRYVITPETYTYQFDLDRPEKNVTFTAVQRYLEGHPGASFVLGAITYRLFPTRAQAPYNASPLGRQWYVSYNTAMMVDTLGLRSYYHKSKLVPAVEILPYQRYLSFLGKVFEFFGGSMSSYGISEDVNNLCGKDPEKIGAMICYESIYGEYMRKTALYGADFLTVITNDGWWGDTPGYRQHFRYARLRAIETRRDIVHVANTGISGFINQRGDVLQRTPWWTPTAIRGTVNLNSKKTCYTVYGDITGRICCFVFVALAAALCVRRFTSRQRRTCSRKS